MCNIYQTHQNINPKNTHVYYIYSVSFNFPCKLVKESRKRSVEKKRVKSKTTRIPRSAHSQSCMDMHAMDIIYWRVTENYFMNGARFQIIWRFYMMRAYIACMNWIFPSRPVNNRYIFCFLSKWLMHTFEGYDNNLIIVFQCFLVF